MQFNSEEMLFTIYLKFRESNWADSNWKPQILFQDKFDYYFHQKLRVDNNVYFKLRYDIKDKILYVEERSILFNDVEQLSGYIDLEDSDNIIIFIGD